MLFRSVLVVFAGATNAFDLEFVDGIVIILARAAASVGRSLRPLQTGQVQSYAWVVFGGLVVVAAVIILLPRLGVRI